ncbi:hypothetical protein ACFVYG_11210 [Streptomyces sp. NPDC058256]|uniref:hypothetical protein n=1 Tax=Streptomyces sp. NPDC058256 TaxID=3346408 RepID=UPI0036E39613
MKQRGRHRRRRRGQALRATLAGTALALTAAATLISTSQATGSGNPGALAPLTSSSTAGKLGLQEKLVAQGTIDTLTRRMGGNVGVAGILDNADHSMRNEGDCDDSERAALPVEPTATRAYCWDSADAKVRQWLPQSVTTSGDAYEDATWGDRRVILAGWTHEDQQAADDSRAGEPTSDEGLARIAFIDATDPHALTYRYALLVVPQDGGKDFEAVRSRLGGMVWYQDKLIVTARNGTALLAFDLRRILETDVNSAAIGKVSGGYSADGYQYVMPAIGSYDLTGGACSPVDDHAVPCFGSLSLDRTSSPDSLVATESSVPGGNDRARVWRYPYSTASDRTGLLAADSKRRVDADEAYETKASGVSGVLSHTPDGSDEPEWYVAQTPSDSGRNGTLWRQTDSGAKAATCTTDQSYACWGLHTSSLSYWYETGELWTLTGTVAADTASGRVLYAVPLSSVDGSLE